MSDLPSRPPTWRFFVTLVIASLGAGITLDGCCPPESRFFLPQERSFATPAGVTDVWIPSAGTDLGDGQLVHAWFDPAPSLDRGAVERAPVMVVLHGIRTQIDALYPLIRPIAERADVSLLMVSNRGYGRSSPCRCVTRRTVVQDAVAAARAAAARPDVDPTRLVVFGYSMGGLSALAAATDPGVEPAAVVIGGTFRSSDAALADAGYEHLAGLIADRHEPIDAIVELDAPVMIVHAADDQVVRVEHALRLAETAEAAGVPVTLRVVSDADHFDVLSVDPALPDQIAAFITAATQD